MIDHVKQKLEAMQAQEIALEQAILDLQDQLVQTRGAVQVLLNVLETYAGGEQDPPPDGKADTFGRK